MSVICAACKTENRDSAMFCLGCAGKLPAFAPTGPSALETMKSNPSRRRQSAAPAALPFEKPTAWIRAGALAFALALGFVVWYAYVTRKAPPPPEPVAAVPAPARMESARPPVEQGRQPPEPRSVPLATSLSEMETIVDAGPAPAPARVESPAVPPPSAAPPAPEPERAQAPPVTTPTRLPAMNPRRGCEHLNFIFAARCEAANCDKPEFKRHPRCDAVREERRRDEARRNPTLGF